MMFSQLDLHFIHFKCYAISDNLRVGQIHYKHHFIEIR